MSAWAGLAGLGLSGLAWSVQPSAGQRRRLARPPGTPGLLTVTGSRGSPTGWLTSGPARRVTALGAGLAVLVMAPTWWGLLIGALTIGTLDRWLSQLPDRATAAAGAQSRRQLPLALELIAAALSAGAPTAAAVVLAARATGPPLSRPLLEVAASLRLGAAADEAWQAARDDPGLQPLARLAVRSAASGAAMAQACRDLAGREHHARVAESEVAIKRAGVLAVLPLALCFLPAFVLVGVVPVVVGLLGSLAL